MPVYPDEIVLPVGDEMRNLLKETSGLIQTLNEFGPTDPLPLRKDEIFVGHGPKDQQRLWELFLDLFNLIPDTRKVFYYTKNGTKIVPTRATMQEVIDMLDFLLVGRNKDDIIEYLRQKAREQVNAPPATVPRGVGVKGKARVSNAANNNTFFGNFGNNYNEYENEERRLVNTRPEIRVNNNEGNYEENYEEENLVQPSRARGPVLNFSQLLSTAKAKKPKRGGLRKKHKTQRRRRTHKKD